MFDSRSGKRTDEMLSCGFLGSRLEEWTEQAGIFYVPGSSELTCGTHTASQLKSATWALAFILARART